MRAVVLLLLVVAMGCAGDRDQTPVSYTLADADRAAHVAPADTDGWDWPGVDAVARRWAGAMDAELTTGAD